MFRSTYRVLGFRDVEYSVYNIYIYTWSLRVQGVGYLDAPATANKFCCSTEPYLRGLSAKTHPAVEV